MDFGWVWGLMLARKSTKNRQEIDLFWHKKIDVTGEGIKLDKRGQKVQLGAILRPTLQKVPRISAGPGCPGRRVSLNCQY